MIVSGCRVESRSAALATSEETKSLFELVFKRFDLEDRELYPLVEHICNRSGVWPLDLTAETDDELDALEAKRLTNK
jgi:hypothetical protein